MAFRFKLDEPIEKGFRRIGVEQIERARRQVSAALDPATEIHEARKCLKRVRALLRLGREGLGETVFHTENARFRSIAAVLAPARDDHVLVETIVKLEASSEETRPALARLKVALLAERPEPAEAATGIDDTLAALDRAARRFRRLRIDPDDFSTLAQGLARSYRRGLKWCDTAYAENTDEGFHEWRKGVQAQWRHMSLLSRAWPALFEARIEAARELSQILGDDHDLAILRERLHGVAPRALAVDDADEVRHLILARQTALRRAAKPRGAMIFAETPKEFARHIEAVWTAARARKHADDPPAETHEAVSPSAREPAAHKAT